ncbi:hypothetical protein LT85_2845 [Collimonas arenae]|uniref:Uncharacterized protein n=1 Tax=Collimonas arenae TaxID=279058 RepID=A0A0A1FB70_9BURK|nr:hypothetical protein LT85_2845 [Collimonas arenae]
MCGSGPTRSSGRDFKRHDTMGQHADMLHRDELSSGKDILKQQGIILPI